jgi:hypothetical protein
VRGAARLLRSAAARRGFVGVRGAARLLRSAAAQRCCAEGVRRRARRWRGRGGSAHGAVRKGLRAAG